MQTAMFSRSIVSKASITILLAALLVGCSGQTKTGSGAKTGALVGAGVGLFLGALTGDAEIAARATAVGAASGAAQGAYEGWRQDEDDRRAEDITEAIRETNTSGAAENLTGDARAREELTRFLGVWSLKGWVQEPGEPRMEVTAQVNGNIEMNYYVELAYIDLQATGIETQIWGSSTLGFDADNGYSISTRFNTLPEPIRVGGGAYNADKRIFTFSGGGAVTTMTFQTPDRYIVETVLDSGEMVESYTLTRS